MAQILVMGLPSIAQMQTDFKQSHQVNVMKFMERYDIDPGRVAILVAGKTILPNESFDITRNNWTCISLTIGG